MNQALKDKFADLGSYVRDGGGARNLVELLFMVEEMISAPAPRMRTILVHDAPIEIPEEVHDEVQNFIYDDQKVRAIKALRAYLGTDTGLLAVKNAVELEGNFRLPKIIYRDVPPITSYEPHPMGCSYCSGYTRHPSYVDQVEADDDAEEVFALDDTGSVEDLGQAIEEDERLRDEPEDLDPNTILAYDPLGVGDEADPQDTVNFAPDAEPQATHCSCGEELVSPGDDECSNCCRNAVEHAEEGAAKECKECGRILIFEETVYCRLCK